MNVCYCGDAMPQFRQEAKFGWKGALELDSKKRAKKVFFDLDMIGNNATKNMKTSTCTIKTYVQLVRIANGLVEIMFTRMSVSYVRSQRHS